MAAVSASPLCSASASIALSKGFTAHQLCSQQAIVQVPLSCSTRSRTQVRQHRVACIKAVKNDGDRVAYDGSKRHKGALVGALLPSVAAMLIGGADFAPEARAEMSSAEYYKSLMESVRRSKEATPAFSAPIAAPPVADIPSLVTSATPVSSKTAANSEVDFSSLFSSSLLEGRSKSKEAAPQEEESSALSAADIRAKRVAEVAKKERDEAEQKAKEAKAQAEAKAKEAAAKAEEETQKKAKEAKEAADKVKAKAEEESKKVAAAAQSKKTHGYLPLFLAQFLFLGLYAGVIVLTFFLPQSQSNKLKATLTELWQKVSPVVEQVKPLADKAVVAGSGLARQAQPYLGKAAREAVPLAKKAVETAKPIVEEATAKVGTAFKKATARSE